MARFHVLMESDGEHGWVAWVPELPGCVTEGRTVEEAKKFIAEAIPGYLQAKACHALRAKKEKQKHCTVTV